MRRTAKQTTPKKKERSSIMLRSAWAGRRKRRRNDWEMAMAVAMTRPLAKTSSQYQPRTRVADDDRAPARIGCGGLAKMPSSFSLSSVGGSAIAKQGGWAAQRRPASKNSVVDMAAAPGSVSGGPQPRWWLKSKLEKASKRWRDQEGGAGKQVP